MGAGGEVWGGGWGGEKPFRNFLYKKKKKKTPGGRGEGYACVWSLSETSANNKNTAEKNISVTFEKKKEEKKKKKEEIGYQ